MKTNKKGIEPVIATVLLIVITIVLVALVVSFVVPWIQNQLTTTGACSSTKLEIKEVCYNSSAVNIRIARGADDLNITNVMVGIANSTGTSVSKVAAPAKYEEIVYPISFVGIPTSAKIAAVVKTGTTETSCDYGQEKAILACA